MNDIKLPPEEDIARALLEAHYDENKGRVNSGAFYTINASVDRLEIRCLSCLWEMYKNNHPSIIRIGQINVGELQKIGKEHVKPTEITVVEDPLPDNYSHAIIPGRVSKGIARRIVENLQLHKS